MGNTPLIAAAKNGKADEVRKLLEQGSDLDVTSHSWTALHFASCRGHLDVVESLLAGGAQVNATTNQGWSPRECLARRGRVHEVLASSSTATWCFLRTHDSALGQLQRSHGSGAGPPRARRRQERRERRGRDAEQARATLPGPGGPAAGVAAGDRSGPPRAAPRSFATNVRAPELVRRVAARGVTRGRSGTSSRRGRGGAEGAPYPRPSREARRRPPRRRPTGRRSREPEEGRPRQ